MRILKEFLSNLTNMDLLGKQNSVKGYVFSVLIEGPCKVTKNITFSVTVQVQSIQVSHTMPQPLLVAMMARFVSLICYVKCATDFKC